MRYDFHELVDAIDGADETDLREDQEVEGDQ